MVNINFKERNPEKKYGRNADKREKMGHNHFSTPGSWALGWSSGEEICLVSDWSKFDFPTKFIIRKEK